MTEPAPHRGAPSQPVADAQVDYARAPVGFEANRGQTDPEVRFLSRGPGHALFLTPEEFVLSLEAAGGGARGAAATVLRMRLLEAARQPRIEGLQQLPGTVRYATGSDPARWLDDVTSFAKVRYQGVYAGVDLVFHRERGQTEYDFVVAPGADPGVVGMAFGGARGSALLGTATSSSTPRWAPSVKRSRSSTRSSPVADTRWRAATSWALRGGWAFGSGL